MSEDFTVYLQLWLSGRGFHKWRKWWRQEPWSGWQTCTWHRIHCWSRGPECSSQVRRSTACPRGCTCVRHKGHSVKTACGPLCLLCVNLNLLAFKSDSKRPEIYLDQPRRGGVAQAKAMIQVKMTPATAWLPVNLKLPIGLQTTMYLSTARTTRDQRAIWPVDRQEGKRRYSLMLHTL